MSIVLFSAIGDTDPISNNYDGSMLHIVRKYKPSIVYLYLSKEMLERDNFDNRYEICVHSAHSDCEIVKIPTELIDAHSFEKFHLEFSQALSGIRKQHPDAEIIVNISSGTPQMKSALALEVVTGNYNLKAVQVATPARGSNQGQRVRKGWAEFSLADDIETNRDNDLLAESRCIEPDLLSFRRAMVSSQIKSLVEEYEYAASINLLNLPGNDKLFTNTKKLRLMLDHCRLRLNWQYQIAMQECPFSKNYRVPDNIEKYVEFYYSLRVHYEKNELGEFIFKTEPLLYELLLFILENVNGITIGELADSQDNNTEWKFRREKISEKDQALLKFLDIDYQRRRSLFAEKGESVTAVNLIKINRYLLRNQKESSGYLALKEIESLFSATKRLRNLIAHDFVSVTPTVIVRHGKMAPDKIAAVLSEIMAKLFLLDSTLFIYDEMNREIVSSLK